MKKPSLPEKIHHFVNIPSFQVASFIWKLLRMVFLLDSIVFVFKLIGQKLCTRKTFRSRDSREPRKFASNPPPVKVPLSRFIRKMPVFARGFFVFVLIFSWIFSGWPQIFNFPPEVEKAYAAFPQVASITESTFTGNTTSHAVSMPATVAAGDLLLVLFTNDGSATVTDPDGAGGWTEISTLARGTFARGSVWAIDAVGDEDGTTVDFVTSASEQASAQVYRILAADWYGDLTDGITATSADPGGTSAAPDPPSLNPSAWDVEDTLWIAYAAGSSWNAVTTYPTDYTDGLHTVSNTGTAGSSASSARLENAAASEDPGAFAMTTTSSGVVFTIGIRPSGVAVPDVPTLYPDDGGSNQIAFNNTRQNDNTPIVRASATHTDTFNRFQVEFNTASNFGGTAYTETFSSTYSSGTQYNLQTTGTLALPTTNGVTYYIRARASADGGTNYGAWSSGIWTYTYTSTAGDAEWFQTTDEQFDTGTLASTQTTGSDSVEAVGSATIAFDSSANNSGALCSATSCSVDITIGAGSNRMIIVAAMDEVDSQLTISSVDIEGNTAAGIEVGSLYVDSGTNDHSLMMWRIMESAIATGANTVTVNFSGPTPTGAGISLTSFSGVAQQAEEAENSTTLTASGDNTIDADVTTLTDGALIVSATGNGGGGGTYTYGTGQTERHMYDPTSGALAVTTEIKASAGLDNQDFLYSAATNRATLYTAAFAPASAAGSGTIMSPEIDFDWVSGQDTWGEAAFSTTETNGDVKLSLYYTDATSCDTIVPNAALSGNESGFDVAASPIDISGLNTTTYNRICLRATLTDSGGTPFLNDWTVNWATAAPSATITLSGTLYTNEGTTEDTSGSDVVTMRVGTSTPGVFSTTTIAGTGFWEIPVDPAGIDEGIPISVFLDSAPANPAFTFTKASSTESITGIDLYHNHVVVKHEATTGTTTTLADLDLYDKDQDTDMPLRVTGGALSVDAGQTLYVAPGTHFAPEGAITLHGAGASLLDGDFKLAESVATGSIMTLGGDLTLAGSFFASSTTLFQASNYGVQFSATTTGKTIAGTLTGDNAFSSTTFSGIGGTGGGWTFSNNASTTLSFAIGNGTVVAPSGGLLTIGGDYSNAGTFNDNGGALYFSSTTAQTLSGTMTGATNDLGDVVFLGSGTKTFFNNASTTAFTIGSGSTVVAPAYLSIDGNYTNSGTFTNNSGTVLFGGSGAGGWDITTAAYDGISATTNSSGEGQPTSEDVFFKSDGTKMYTIGWSAEKVHQYTLSTPWDLSSASYDSVSTSTNSSGESETRPRGLFFKSDGSKMYMIGGDTDMVHQYTLSTPWVLSSAAYDSVSTSTNSSGEGEASYEGLFFKEDGTKMYTAGWDTNKLFQYTLSSAWDISSASYDNISTSTNSSGEGEGSPAALFIKSDGAKMYMIGWNNTVYQYTLSTPWDLSSAAYDGVAVDVNADTGETNAEGVFFKDDGTKMYANGFSTDRVYQYTIGDSQILSGTMTGSSAFNDVTFSGSGTKSFAANASSSAFTIGSGAAVTAPATFLSISGDYTNAGSFTDSVGTVLFDGTDQTIAGTMNTTLTDFADVIFSGSGTKTFSNNASTTAFAIESGSTVVAPVFLSISGDYTNAGSFTAGGGTTILSGASPQTISGTLNGTSAFGNLEVTNTSGDPDSSPSIVFSSAPSTFGTFFARTGGSSIQFPAGATTSLAHLFLQGGNGNLVHLRSSSASTTWGLNVPGFHYAVSYVDVADSDACTGNTINASDGTNNDASGNFCWNFGGGFAADAAAISSIVDQTFTAGQATTTLSDIRITDATTTPTIVAANDIRIAIATSTHDMRFDTNATVSISGIAVPNKVAAAPSVTYEGGDSVAVIPVSADFEAGDTLVISGLKLGAFTTVASAASALSIRAGGASDMINDNTDDKTIAIVGALALAEHDLGQVPNAFSSSNSTVTAEPLFAFTLTPAGEETSISSITFPLSGVDDITSGDIQNALLYIDYDGSRNVNGGDEAVGGAGTPSISGTGGSITFSSSFTATTTRNYVLIADVVGIQPYDRFIMSLGPTNITASGVSTSGTIILSGAVSLTQHIRATAGDYAEIGGFTIEGAGIVSGGGSSGGEEIGSSPGFNTPASVGAVSNWTSGNSGRVSDDAWGTVSVNGTVQEYTNFGFSIPSGNTITGIEVKLEANGGTANTIGVELGTGAATTSAGLTTGNLTGSDTVYSVGGSSQTFGRSWTPAEFNDGTFVVELTANISSGSVNLDAIQVKVHHVAGGGGGGGGGEALGPPHLFLANVYKVFERLFGGMFEF